MQAPCTNSAHDGFADRCDTFFCFISGIWNLNYT